MSGIAQIMLEKGYEVSGSDIKPSHITQRLQSMGAKIFTGHCAANIHGADTVVYSTAIPETNIEVKAALENNLTVVRRAVMLGMLMNAHRGIAVAGTHGKTTITSMISYVFQYNNLNPTSIIGGELAAINSNARFGTDSALIAEADESDASFLCLSPEIAIVTSIDDDVNLNVEPWKTYKNDRNKLMKKISEIFLKFTERVKSNGTVILCADNAEVRKIINRIDRNIITYGITENADLTASSISLADFHSASSVFLHGKKIGDLILNVPGRHNIQNALACTAACMSFGMDAESIFKALKLFGGLKRRFEKIGCEIGVTVIDDYAHNPSKIRAAIHAARTGDASRVIAVCQPHRYSRTKFQKNDLSESFYEADILIITDIYGAGEKADPEISGNMIAELTKLKSPNVEVHFIPDPEDAFEFLIPRLREGDLVIALGAGNISAYAKTFVDKLRVKTLNRIS